MNNTKIDVEKKNKKLFPSFRVNLVILAMLITRISVFQLFWVKNSFQHFTSLEVSYNRFPIYSLYYMLQGCFLPYRHLNQGTCHNYFVCLQSYVYSQNLYPIYDLSPQFYPTLFMTRPKIITLFRTVAADTIFNVVIFEGLLFLVLLIMIIKQLLLKTITQFKTRVQKPQYWRNCVASLELTSEG